MPSMKKCTEYENAPRMKKKPLPGTRKLHGFKPTGIGALDVFEFSSQSNGAKVHGLRKRSR